MKYGFFWISSKIITLGMIMKFFFMAPANFSASTQPPSPQKKKKIPDVSRSVRKLVKTEKKLMAADGSTKNFQCFFYIFGAKTGPKSKKWVQNKKSNTKAGLTQDCSQQRPKFFH